MFASRTTDTVFGEYLSTGMLYRGAVISVSFKYLFLPYVLRNYAALPVARARGINRCTSAWSHVTLDKSRELCPRGTRNTSKGIILAAYRYASSLHFVLNGYSKYVNRAIKPRRWSRTNGNWGIKSTATARKSDGREETAAGMRNCTVKRDVNFTRASNYAKIILLDI